MKNIILGVLFFISPLLANNILTVYKNGYYTSQSTITLPKISGTNYFSINIPKNVNINSIILLPYDKHANIVSYDLIDEKPVHYKYSKPMNILEKLTNKTIEILDSNNETFRGTLLKIYPQYFYVKDSMKHYFLIDKKFIKSIKSSALAISNTHPSTITNKKEIHILYSSDSSAKVGLFYTSNGLSCKPLYKIKLDTDSKTLLFRQDFEIQNSLNTEFTNIKLRYVDGVLNAYRPRSLSYNYKRSYKPEKQSRASLYSEAVPTPNAEINSAVSKKHILNSDEYSIKPLINIAPYSHKFINNFSISSIPYNKSFISYGSTPNIQITFTNNKKNQLGFSLSPGTAKLLYQENNVLHLIGNTSVPKTILNNEVKFFPGLDNDIQVNRITKDKTTISKTVTQYTIKITIKNSKKETIDFELLQSLYGKWKIKKSSDKYKKKNANAIIFKFTMAPQSKKIIEYTYRLKK